MLNHTMIIYFLSFENNSVFLIKSIFLSNYLGFSWTPSKMNYFEILGFFKIHKKWSIKILICNCVCELLVTIPSAYFSRMNFIRHILFIILFINNRPRTESRSITKQVITNICWVDEFAAEFCLHVQSI